VIITNIKKLPWTKVIFLTQTNPFRIGVNIKAAMGNLIELVNDNVQILLGLSAGSSSDAER